MQILLETSLLAAARSCRRPRSLRAPIRQAPRRRLTLQEKLQLDPHAAELWKLVRRGDVRCRLDLSDKDYAKACERAERQRRRRRGGVA